MTWHDWMGGLALALLVWGLLWIGVTMDAEDDFHGPCLAQCILYVN